MFARGNGFQHQRLGNAVTTNQFDDDVDIRVGNHRAGITDHRHARANQFLRTGDIEVGHHGDFNTTTGTAFDFFLVALQHVKRARTDDANAQKTNLNRFHNL